MNNKGFLLVDAMVCMLIIISLCSLGYMLVKTGFNYKEGYKNYIEYQNERLSEIYNNRISCERCLVEDDQS